MQYRFAVHFGTLSGKTLYDYERIPCWSIYAKGTLSLCIIIKKSSETKFTEQKPCLLNKMYKLIFYPYYQPLTNKSLGGKLTDKIHVLTLSGL